MLQGQQKAGIPLTADETRELDTLREAQRRLGGQMGENEAETCRNPCHREEHEEITRQFAAHANPVKRTTFEDDSRS